jgi:hypothetical protein
MHLHTIFLHVKCNVCRVQEVVGKKLLDHVSLVPETDYKVVDAMLTVYLENVP